MLKGHRPGHDYFLLSCDVHTSISLLSAVIRAYRVGLASPLLQGSELSELLALAWEWDAE